MSVTYKRSPEDNTGEINEGQCHVQGQGEEEEGTGPWGNSGWQFGLTCPGYPFADGLCHFRTNGSFPYTTCPPPGRGETEPALAGVPSEAPFVILFPSFQACRSC